MLAVCSIDGCEKKARSHGWCEMHYTSWRRHGDPLVGRRHGKVEVYFREVVMAYEGDDCLKWPFSTGAGYGHMRRNGAKHIVSRLVCEEEHGPPPTPQHEAAHSCGKGHEGCCTKRHLSWKTPAENYADAVRHGTAARGVKNPQAKLTEETVIELRRLKGRMTATELASRYGVSIASISAAQTGRTWGWL